MCLQRFPDPGGVGHVQVCVVQRDQLIVGVEARPNPQQVVPELASGSDDDDSP